MFFSDTTFMAVPRASNDASRTCGSVSLTVWKKKKNEVRGTEDNSEVNSTLYFVVKSIKMKTKYKNK